MKCNEPNHADSERLIEWVNNPKRKPAVLAFTSGPERNVAYAVENTFLIKD